MLLHIVIRVWARVGRTYIYVHWYDSNRLDWICCSKTDRAFPKHPLHSCLSIQPWTNAMGGSIESRSSRALATYSGWNSLGTGRMHFIPMECLGIDRRVVLLCVSIMKGRPPDLSIIRIYGCKSTVLSRPVHNRQIAVILFTFKNGPNDYF